MDPWNERGQGRFKVSRSSREETPRLPFSGNDGGGLASPRAAGTRSRHSVKAKFIEGCTFAPLCDSGVAIFG